MHDKRDFDAHAATWDGNPSRVKLAREISAAMTSSIEIRKDMDALDFGCGTGLVTLALQPLARTVTGIDSSRGMLEALDRKIAAAGLRNIKTAFYDADSGEPVPGRYHAAVSSMTFHHVRDTEALLRRLHEALHPGGTLCVADLDPDGGLFHADNTGVFHFGFDRDRMRGLFRQAGFDNVRALTAAEVTRPVAGGGTRSFSIFLIIGEKHH